jgi:hypothetical protein
MPGYRDQDKKQNPDMRDERRPWEGYGARTAQTPDYGSAGGQYTARIGPDQDPYTRDEGAYAGAHPDDEDGVWDDERSGRGRGGYGQVGGRREQARDEGGYSRASRRGSGGYGQGGYGEERGWGRDRGGAQTGYWPGNPPASNQLAYGPNAQNYGQAVEPGYGSHGRSYGTDGREAGQGDAHDRDYGEWRREQGRRYDEDYGAWRERQMRQHDDDYAAWRRERRDRFGADFSDWRSKRPADPTSEPSAGKTQKR